MTRELLARISKPSELPNQSSTNRKQSMTVDIPADLEPFVQRLIAERRFLTESDVLSEGLRLLQAQESLRGAVRQGFTQLDEGSVVLAEMVFAKAEERIAAVERAQRA